MGQFDLRGELPTHSPLIPRGRDLFMDDQLEVVEITDSHRGPIFSSMSGRWMTRFACRPLASSYVPSQLALD